MEPDMLDEGLLEVSPEGNELIDKMLLKDPQQRYSAK